MAAAEAQSPPAPARPPSLRELLGPLDAPAPLPPPSRWRATLVSFLLHAAVLGPLALLVHSTHDPNRLQEIVVEADLDQPYDLFDAPADDADANAFVAPKLERLPPAPLPAQAPAAAVPKPDLGAELARALKAPEGAGAPLESPLGNAGAAAAGGAAGVGEGATFAKLSAKGRRFVFCIDRSASMNEHDAIEFARRELIASIDKLQPHMEFQVVFYNEAAVPLEFGGPRKGRKELIPASAPNRVRAINLVRETVAGGGTNHRTALTLALEMRPDAIFLMTDAEDEPEEIARLVAWLAGQARKRRDAGEAASVHVIQYWHNANKPPQTAIEEVARQNRGSYRLVEAAKLDPDAPP